MLRNSTSCVVILHFPCCISYCNLFQSYAQAMMLAAVLPSIVKVFGATYLRRAKKPQSTLTNPTDFDVQIPPFDNSNCSAVLGLKLVRTFFNLFQHHLMIHLSIHRLSIHPQGMSRSSLPRTRISTALQSALVSPPPGPAKLSSLPKMNSYLSRCKYLT